MDQARDAEEKAKGWRGSHDLWLMAAREALIESGIDSVKIQPLAERLKLSRTSFYWFFDDRAQLLDALLDDWQSTNTRSLVAASQAFAETIAEAVLNVIGVFLPNGGFESRLDLAIRGWAHRSDKVAALVIKADQSRLDALCEMFTRFGFDPAEADVRARTMYLVQIGYISMQVNETVALRMARAPNYVKTFSGQEATASELARFQAQYKGRARSE